MSLRPLHDRIVVEPKTEKDNVSQGGIVLPDTAKERPIDGVVLAVGLGKQLENGQIRVPAVKPGDKVLFGKYAGTEVEREGKKLLVLREEDIMAVVD